MHGCNRHQKRHVNPKGASVATKKLCDVIGIIHDGKLLTEGTLAQLRERYAEQDLEEIFVKIVSPLQARVEA